MHNFNCPWRYPSDCRTPCGPARMTFVKPFINGVATRYFRMLDVVSRQGPMSRREIVAQSFGGDYGEAVRKWENLSYGDYFTAFSQAGLLFYNRKTRLWEAGPNLKSWYDEVVHPHLACNPISLPKMMKETVKPEPPLMTTEQRLVILYRATKEKMKHLLDTRQALDDEIKTVDKVMTALETIHTFFPVMED